MTWEPITPARRKRRIVLMRNTRRAKRAEGICYDCPRRTDGKHARCLECRVIRAERKRRRLAA
jgi:hypothetical protein